MPIPDQGPIKRRYPFQPRGRVRAVEYPLPGLSIPARVRRRLDPWLAQSTGFGSDVVRSRLKDRWSALKGAGMGAVANHFLRFTPQSILVTTDVAWLVLREPPRTDPDSGTEWIQEWFLPAPTAASVIDGALARFRIRESRRLRVFLREFAGFREELPNISGYFPHIPDWCSFADYVDEMGWKPSRMPRIWSRAAVFYVSLNGDVLLLDSAARLAWWDHEMDTFRILLKDFHDFPAHWLRFIRRVYPFSSWLPTE